MGKQNKYPDINFKDKDIDKIAAGRDTTAIKKPYRVTSSELNSELGLSGSNTQDSTRKKVAYNISEVVPSMIKRNLERAKEGKKTISYQSITGAGTYGFSNIGQSFSSSPIKNKKK